MKLMYYVILYYVILHYYIIFLMHYYVKLCYIIFVIILFQNAAGGEAMADGSGKKTCYYELLGASTDKFRGV